MYVVLDSYMELLSISMLLFIHIHMPVYITIFSHWEMLYMGMLGVAERNRGLDRTVRALGENE
jgi:hypothetical protein